MTTLSPMRALTVLRVTVAVTPIPIPAEPPIAPAPAAPWTVILSSAFTVIFCVATSL